MNDLEKAEIKYKNDPIFNKIVDTLFDALKNNIIKSHELDLAVKLAHFKDDVETMRGYEEVRDKL